MKKFYSFLVAAVVLMVATSCQKEAVENGFVGENAEFTASIASGRTELGDGNKVMWNSGDNIRIFTQENAAGNKFSGDAEAATATAKFTTTENFVASENGYLAVYPETANTGNATYENGVWSVPVNLLGFDFDFSGTAFEYPFTFEKNSFMAAFSNDNQLSFKAATAMLKIKNVKNAGWGAVAFTGANLGGAATLHYNTNNAEDPISYTLGSGDSRVDYNFPNDAETIYVPIYPGTVTGFTVYSGNDVLVEYTKEITFKAGFIYDLDLENAGIGGDDVVTSPWSIVDPMYNVMPISMTIENGYHVAKNVPFFEQGYKIADASWSQMLSVTTEGAVTLGSWVEIGMGLETRITFEADYVDIYLTEDASLMCIVPAGTPFENLPALPTYEPSTYMLMDMNTFAPIEMVIKDGFHYAKLKLASGESWSDHTYLVVAPGGNGLGFTTATATPSTWYKTGAYSDTSAYQPIKIESYAGMEAQVYISADGEWLGVEYLGFDPLPDVPTVSTWGIRGLNGDWDNSVTMYDMGDYSVAYGVTVTSDCTFKFLNTNGVWAGLSGTLNMNAWNSIGGNDIAIAAGTYDFYKLNNPYGSYLICAPGTALPTYKAEVKSNCLYLLPNSYWSEANARFAAYFFGNAGNTWVSMTKVGEEGYYEVEIPTGDYANVIFCRRNPASAANGWDSNNWGQTDDLTVPTNGNNLYTITQTTDNWKAGSWSTLE